MLAYCPEPPPGLRRDRALTGPTDVPAFAALSVVHVGQAAALLATRSGALVPVTAGPTCLVPGGIGVPDPAALAALLVRWSGLAGGAVTDLRAWHASATAVDLRLADRVTATRAQVVELDRGLAGRGADPAAAERAEGLACSALGAGGLAACVAATVGAGPGTTPAGDDALCGVLAGLDLLGLAAAHRRLGAAVAPLLPTTTRVSRHLLAAAIAGRYTERLTGLATAVASGRSVRGALDALARWGASSGLDQAAGFAAAVRAGSLAQAGVR